MIFNQCNRPPAGHNDNESKTFRPRAKTTSRVRRAYRLSLAHPHRRRAAAQALCHRGRLFVGSKERPRTDDICIKIRCKHKQKDNGVASLYDPIVFLLIDFRMGPGETLGRHEKNTAELECGSGGPETMGRWGAGFVVLDGFWCLFSGGGLRTGAWFGNHSPWVAVQSLERSIGGGSNRQWLAHANGHATEDFQDPICLRVFSLPVPPSDVLSGIAVQRSKGVQFISAILPCRIGVCVVHVSWLIVRYDNNP